MDDRYENTFKISHSEAPSFWIFYCRFAKKLDLILSKVNISNGEPQRFAKKHKTFNLCVTEPGLIRNTSCCCMQRA